jgi:small-conductance mechanosensitive channel
MLDILLAVARAHPRVLSEPPPVAPFLGFGDSALRFEMRAWTDRFDLWMETQSELAMALYAALTEAGFEIPFPQHEVRLQRAAERRTLASADSIGPTSHRSGAPVPL